MPQPLRPFWLTLLALWTLLIGAAIAYSNIKNIPWPIATAVVPAFLLEAGLYLASGTESVRSRIELLPPWKIAAWLIVSAVAPYLLYSLSLGLFEVLSLLAVSGLAASVAFWYVLFGRRAAADIALLGFMAAVVLGRIFPRIYPEPEGMRLGVAVLGQAMWIRLGIVAVLSIRRMEGIGFSFLPRRLDWKIGLRNYLIFLPSGLGLGLVLGFLQPSFTTLRWQTLFLAVATFAGVLWVVALSEEFFFRGILQQWLHRTLPGKWWAIGITSILFGLVHLGFGGRFPNWRFVMLATVAGVFYGRAYAQARSIRASMVTHALVVTTWRVFW